MLLFNRYEYNPRTDLVGRGDLSRVYKAIDTVGQTPVAVKIYTLSGEGQWPLEVQHTLLGLADPHICTYRFVEEMDKEDSFGEKEHFLVCIMDWMGGGSIFAHRETAVLKRLLGDVIRGLDYLHHAGLIHRRVKSSNLLTADSPSGPIGKVTDIGYRLKDGKEESGLLTGVAYLAPEQISPARYGVNGKSSFNLDWWSLGVTTYEMITGELLFREDEQDSREQVMNRILSPEVPPQVQQLPEPFRGLVAACLVKDARLRVNDPAQLLDLLEAPLEEGPDEDATVILPRPRVKVEEIDNDPTLGLEWPKDGEQEPVDGDATVILPRLVVPKDPEPVEEEADEAATVVMRRPEAPKDPEPVEPEADEAATVVMRRPVAPKDPEPVEDEADEAATVVMRRPAASKDPEPVADDADEAATVVLPRSTAPTASTPLTPPSPPPPPPPPIPPPPPLEPRPASPALAAREEPVLLFNRYEYNPYTGLIGRGGFSRVYKAIDRRLSRSVALKIYKTSEFPDRYSPIAEIRRVINLDHPNICRYLDIEETEKENAFGEKEVTQICVMELLDGGNFAEYYNKHKTEEVLTKLVGDVLAGLAYLHRNGIIHRDIKPANILIKETVDGPVAKITDFGISKGTESINSNTSSALVVSIPYMAPEQLNIKKYGIQEKINYNLDLWSLGVALYEVITGKVLFKNSETDSSEQIMTNIMAPELPEKIKELPQPFLDIVSHCIVKDANDRARKAEELIVLLHANRTEAPKPAAPKPISVVHKQPTVVPPPAPIPESPRPEALVAAGTPRSSVFAEQVADDAPITAKPGWMTSMMQANRMEVYLKILAVAGAAGILIFLFLRIYSDRRNAPVQKAAPVVVAPAVKADTTTPVVTVSPPRDTVVASPPPVPQTAQPTQAAQSNKGDKKPARTVASGTSYKLELSSDKACHVTVNGSDYGDLDAGGNLRLSLEVGNYTLKATSLTDRTSYEVSFEIKPQNLGQVGHRRINLQ